MGKYVVLLFVVCVGVVVGQRMRIDDLKRVGEEYRATRDALLTETERYKTENGLNAARVRELRLTLEEYETRRRSDAEVIAQLELDKKNIRRIVSSQTSTIYHVETAVEVKSDSARCIDYSTEWLDMQGCFDSAWNFSGTICSRDRLLYVEHVIPKRFLGFLWRTRRVKKREQEIVSRNPHTEIMDVEFVTVVDD